MNTALTYESSIVIPVYNKWELTRACLKSLASTTDRHKTQVIVVDNASSDVTAKACPFLGQELFGASFQYIRNEQNRNFAGASNQGASLAAGEFLIFLNNDTEPQPGWYQPLIDDFATYPGLGATGPLLLYPQKGPLGLRVQHLGIQVNPFFKFLHLYEGIPAASPLARKRRFFQAITAACLVMPKSLFFATGAFDERFVNGFEDVDLCARIGAAGYRMTVNPEAVVIHHEGQSEGRHGQDNENYNLLMAKSASLLTPDWHIRLEEDGLELRVDDWIRFGVAMPAGNAQKLESLAKAASHDKLCALLLANPYWEGGWRSLLAQAIEPAQKAAIFKILFKLFRTPENALEGQALGRALGDRELLDESLAMLRAFSSPPGAIRQNVIHAAQWCASHAMPKIAAQYESWLLNFQTFREKIYPEFARKFMRMANEEHLDLNPLDTPMYNFWFYGRKPQEIKSQASENISFSILLTGAQDRPDFFKATLDSILDQSLDKWELLVATDATSEASVIIDEYMRRDQRIKILAQKPGTGLKNWGEAISQAQNPWMCFMESGDLLEPDALSQMALAIQDRPDLMLFYSDEDSIDANGDFYNPYFKNGKWDPELARAQDFSGQLTVFSREHLIAIAKDDNPFPIPWRCAQTAGTGQAGHVPRILYHGRVREDKGEPRLATPEMRKDCQDIPISIILAVPDKKFDLESHAQNLLAKSDESLELIYIVRQTDMPVFAETIARLAANGIQVALSTGIGEVAGDLNRGARLASGRILGFLEPSVLPEDSAWLEEITRGLEREGIGAIGGCVTVDGQLVNGGYLTDGKQRLKPLFADSREGDYHGWRSLPRTVDCLDGLCLFTKADEFAARGGLDAAMGTWAIQDYCLRLGQKELANIWLPNARFMSTRKIRNAKMPASFSERWQGSLTPFNPNLAITGRGFALL